MSEGMLMAQMFSSFIALILVLVWWGPINDERKPFETKWDLIKAITISVVAVAGGFYLWLGLGMVSACFYSVFQFFKYFHSLPWRKAV